MKNIFHIILFISFFSVFGQAQGIIFQPLSWKKAQILAEKSNKPIFLDAYTTWCAPCKMMEKDVFTDANVAAFFNENFICIKMDMEQGEGLDLAREFNIHAFPTFIFADANNKVFHAEAGGKNVAQTIAMGNLSLNKNENLAAKDKFFNEGGADDLTFLQQYVAQRFALQNNSHQAAAEAFLTLQNDLSSAENKAFIMQYVQNPASKAFKYLLERKNEFIQSFGKPKVESKIENCIYNELYEASSRSGAEAMQSILQRQYGERADYYLARYKVVLAKSLLQQNEFTNAAEQYFQAFPPEDPAEYSTIALYATAFKQDKNLIKTALSWVEKGIAKEDNFDCRYAKARLYQYWGKNKKAKKYANEAKVFAEKNGEDASKAVKILERL